MFRYKTIFKLTPACFDHFGLKESFPQITRSANKDLHMTTYVVQMFTWMDN